MNPVDVNRIKKREIENNENGFHKYFIDVEKIRGSDSLKRLAYKTQVFTQVNCAHVRTRLIHTMDVIGVGLTIAEKFNKLKHKDFEINSKLVEAICMGHDVGHTPFGHCGERVLKKINGDFNHNKNSVVLLELIEDKGTGLGLTKETLTGILKHTRKEGFDGKNDDKFEHTIAAYADKFAYIFNDIIDAQKYNILSQKPKNAIKLGHTKKEQISTCINALIKESLEKGYISFTNSEEAELFYEIKKYMNENVYSKVDSEIAPKLIGSVHDFLGNEFKNHDPLLLTSLLTDNEVLEINKYLVSKTAYLNQLCKEIFISISEIIPYSEGFKVDYNLIDEKWINSLY